MSKKAKTEANPVQAVLASIPQSVAQAKPTGTNGAAVMFAALNAAKKGGAMVAGAKEGKSKVLQVAITDPAVKTAKKTFILEAAKKKAAESRMAGPGDILREWGENQRIVACRSAQSLHKTICLDGDVNLGGGRLAVAKPNSKATPPLTEESITLGLTAVMGETFDTYIAPELELTVASEYANQAGIELLQNKLGLDVFQRFFPSVKVKIALKREKSEDPESTVLLNRDAALNPAVEVKVKRAVLAGYLTESKPALTPQGDAIAAAQAQLAEEERQRLQAQQGMQSAVATGIAAAVAVKTA